MELTNEQQLDNLIRWRDELASGNWRKYEGSYDGPGGSHCAFGVAIEVFGCDALTSIGSRMTDIAALPMRMHSGIVGRNDDNPGDDFAAVIEYLNEEITRRKVALGLPATVAEDAGVLV